MILSQARHPFSLSDVQQALHKIVIRTIPHDATGANIALSIVNSLQKHGFVEELEPDPNETLIDTSDENRQRQFILTLQTIFRAAGLEGNRNETDLRLTFWQKLERTGRFQIEETIGQGGM